jgi:hypothetical protein
MSSSNHLNNQSLHHPDGQPLQRRHSAQEDRAYGRAANRHRRILPPPNPTNRTRRGHLLPYRLQPTPHGSMSPVPDRPVYENAIPRPDVRSGFTRGMNCLYNMRTVLEQQKREIRGLQQQNSELWQQVAYLRRSNDDIESNRDQLAGNNATLLSAYCSIRERGGGRPQQPCNCQTADPLGTAFERN